MGTRLYVGNLSYNTTEASLRAAFAEDGRAVRQVTLVTDRMTGQPRGFAFVEMETDEGAAQAIKVLDGRDLDGRTLRVSEARPREAGGGAPGAGAPRSFGGGGAPRPYSGGGGTGGYGGGGGGYAGGGAGGPGAGTGGGFADRGGAPAAPQRNFGPDARPGGGRNGGPPRGKSDRDREGDGGRGAGGKRKRKDDDWGG